MTAVATPSFVLAAAAALTALAALLGTGWSWRRSRQAARSLAEATARYCEALRALERLAGLAVDHGATLGQVRRRVGPTFLIDRADEAEVTVEMSVIPPRRRPSPRPRPATQTATQTYGQGRQSMQPWPPPPGGNAMDQTKVMHPRLRRLNGGDPS